MANITTDFLVIGGGVIGINMALHAKARYPDADVTVLEKEPQCGEHASGRNSGVLHAGFYYSADSLKARLTREGNRRITEYCLERGLRINQCGKLVVARSEADLTGLDELLRRAKLNGVELNEISEQDATEIEPRVRVFQRALFSPTTASVDPVEVMQAFVSDAENAGIHVRGDTQFIARSAQVVETTRGNISAGYVINASGLYADRIARQYGFSENFRILPFKGLYLNGIKGASQLRTNIYPVPDLRNPFLGVHHTVAVDGKPKLGPTAIPCFWREHYGGFENFRFDELVDVMMRNAGLFLKNDFGFRGLAWEEIQKYRRSYLLRLASELVSDINDKAYPHWGKPGIRAQLLDIKARRLEMDFRTEGDDRSFHILNAVSPAFTCSTTFSEYAFDRIDELL